MQGYVGWLPLSAGITGKGHWLMCGNGLNPGLCTLDKHFCQPSYIPGQENYACYLKTQLPYLPPSSTPGTVHCFLCR